MVYFTCDPTVEMVKVIATWALQVVQGVLIIGGLKWLGHPGLTGKSSK